MSVAFSMHNTQHERMSFLIKIDSLATTENVIYLRVVTQPSVIIRITATNHFSLLLKPQALIRVESWTCIHYFH